MVVLCYACGFALLPVNSVGIVLFCLDFMDAWCCSVCVLVIVWLVFTSWSIVGIVE